MPYTAVQGMRGMSGDHFPVARNAASQVLPLLERYEAHSRTLAADFLQMNLYGLVSEDIDAIRQLCSQIPEISVPWVRLLITHAEWIHSLWLAVRAGGGTAPRQREERLADHLAAIAALAQHCAEVARRT